MWNQKVIIKEYPEKIWGERTILEEYIENVFNQLEKLTGLSGSNVFEAHGKVLSTASMDPTWIIESEEFKTLYNWIMSEIEESAEQVYDKPFTKIIARRIWANKTFKNSYADWHQHGFKGIIAVFYLYVPKNGSNLMTPEGIVESKTNRLLIHSSEMPHSVTVHKSDEPRIALIVEVSLKNEL